MEELIIKKKKFIVESVVAEHEDHSSYVCTYSGVKYLVRVYRKDYQKVLEEYRRLKHAGINMAKMNYHDDENQIIAFDYFPEKDVLEVLSEKDLPEEYFKALFALNHFSRFSKIALDWAPQNFMYRGTQMFYLPIKVTDLTEENGLEKEGLKYWFRGKEALAILKKKGFDISGITPLSDAEVNKACILTVVKYW